VPDIDTVRTWQGRTLVDRDGNRIGTIDAIYLDDRTGQPEWALVNTGLFGTKSSFVPLAQAAQTGDDVRVPYDKQLVKDAPQVDADQHLSEAEEQQLWRHYGLDYDAPERHVGTGGRATNRGTVGRDVSGPTTDDAMTRSEEELRVGTAERERGRVRLRKYVTTEQVQ
jgi:sporulation protein YlmC with PRC-barrel domain